MNTKSTNASTASTVRDRATRATYKGHGQPQRGTYFGRANAAQPKGQAVTLSVEGSLLVVRAARGGAVVEKVGPATKFWLAPVTEVPATGKGKAAPAPKGKAASTKAAPAPKAAPAERIAAEVGQPMAGHKGYAVVLNRGYYAVGHNPEAAPEARYVTVLRTGLSAHSPNLATAKSWGKGEGYRAGLTTRATKASTDAGLTEAPAYRGKADQAPQAPQAAPAPAKGKGRAASTKAAPAPAKGKGKGQARGKGRAA